MLIIRGGRIIDPGNFEGPGTIYIDEGKIVAVEPMSGKGDNSATAGAQEKDKAAQVINAAGLVITPGLIDMHVHLREPGHEYKETIASGCRAAVFGGITAVCAMPNTNPVNDNREVTEFILAKAQAAGLARVYPVAAISCGLAGESLSEYGELKDAGAVAVSDDGCPVTDDQLMRRAMEYAKGFGLPVISHCENLHLAGKGVMNEGVVATRLGLAGIPNAAEAVMVMRDISICALTGAALHIAHVSTRESVAAIRAAKKQGINVTAETAPHYFSLTDSAVGNYNTHAKMNPPLRSERDREAIREGLADGTLDVIATDHAPHSQLEKAVEFDKAANGIIGLETSVPLSLGLVRDGVLSLDSLVKKMSTAPAEILGKKSGLMAGSPADLTIIDLEKKIVVDDGFFRSLSRNSPFSGWEMVGKAVLTMVGGRIVYTELPTVEG